MLRSLVLGALVGAAAAKSPDFTLERSYDAGSDETSFTYTVTADGDITLFSVPVAGCSVISTDAGLSADDSMAFTSGSGSYDFTLSGNIPIGQTSVSGVVSGEEWTDVGEGPNCAAADSAPVCPIVVQNVDTVTCANDVATVSLSTVGSAATYAWSASAGTFTSSNSSSTTLQIPVDECSEEVLISLLCISAGSSQATTTATANYKYSSVLAFSSAPANLRVQTADVPAAETLTATGADSCFDPTITFTESKSSVAGSTYVMTRTWVLTDECSGAVQHQQQIEVFDSVPPVITGVPADQTVTCDNVPPPCEASAYDDADNTDTLVAFSETRNDGSCPSSYTLMRTWTTTDSSGNSAAAHQTIYVEDQQNPVLIGAPSDLTAECNAVPGPAIVTGHDNCDRSVEVVLSESDMSDTGVIRTWTVSDLCGNTNSVSQTVSVTDSVAPVLAGVEADKTVECNLVPSSPCEVTAKDVCDGTVAVTHSQVIVPGSCPDSYTIENTWTATDATNLTSTSTQTITVEDTTAPTINGVLTNNMPVSCDRTIPDVSTAYDQCDDDVSVVSSDETIDSVDTHNYKIVRAYDATDDCGNVATDVATIIFTDDAPPTLDNTPMAVVNVQCSAVPDANIVTATDNCESSVAVTYTEATDAGSCLNEYTIIRTWTAADTSANSVTFVQTINVIDTDEPTMSPAPSSVTAECDAVPPGSAGQVTSEDSCGAVTEDYTEVTISSVCNHTYTLVRTWSVVDNCGNAESQTQTVEVSDNTPPTLVSVPGHDGVECDSIPDAANVTATENCASVSVEFTETTVAGSCEFDYKLLRAWDVTDDCGNTDSEVQTITVVDTTIPEVVDCVSGDQGPLELFDDYPVNSAADYSSTDNCDTVTTEYDTQVTGATCTETLTRTWTAYDDCGHQASPCVHTWSIGDTTPPNITAPEDRHVECDFPAAGPDTVEDYLIEEGLVATYEGNNATHLGPTCEKTTDDCDHSAVYTCTYVVSDECGNTDTDTQTITISDNNAPTFDNTPVDVTKECEEVASADLTVMASDLCDGAASITAEYTPTVLQTDNGTVIELRIDTWTATDKCGNSVSQWRTVLIEDTTKPTVTCPAPSDVECKENEPLEADIAVVAYDDSCKIRGRTASITSTYNEEGDYCDKDHNKTYIVSDDSGNSIECSFDWYIEDVTDPTCTELPDDTVECTNDNEADYPIPDLANCDDNCDAAVTLNKDQVLVTYESCTADDFVASIYRSWIVTDECGNDTPYDQTLTIEDTTPPVLSGVPGAINPNCTYTEGPPTVTADDECSGTAGVTIAYVSSMTDEEIAAGCAPFSWTRTWTATDECGLTDVGTQVISVQGNVALQWASIPDAFSVDQEFSNSPNTSAFAVSGDLEAYSECATESITCAVTEEAGSCDHTWDYINTCSVTSRCDTTGLSFQQTISIQDTIPDYISAGDDETLDCATVADGLTPENNCTDSEPDCASCTHCYTVTRTCSTVDECGNEDSDSRVITVVDNAAPVITVPADYTADCAGDGLGAGTYPLSTANATVTDNCDLDIGDAGDAGVLATAVDTELADSEANQLVKYAYRTFSATDVCGNTASSTQTIEFYDTTDPEMCEPYTDDTFEHNGVDIWGNDFTRPADNQMSSTPGSCICPESKAVWDDCSSTELACDRITNAGSCPQNFEHVYTWINVDAEGNTATSTWTVTIEDTTPPVFNPAFIADVAVSTHAIPSIPTVTASDQSTSPTTITYTEERLDGDNVNEFSLVRTWSVVDECGNSEAMYYTITVTDEREPIIEGTPSDIVITCEEAPTINHADVTATVEHWADQNTTIVSDEEILPGTCPQEFKVVYSFTATDVADNTSQDSYTVTVSDTTSPTWTTALPQDKTVNGCTTEDAAIVSAEDECAGSLVASGDDAFSSDSGAMFGTQAIPAVLTEETIPFEAGGDYDVVRVWTATDDCGNFISHPQTIKMRDTVAPVFDNLVDGEIPGAINMNVNDTCVTPAAATVTCTDACYECTVTVATTYEYLNNCAKPHVIYTYTTTDTEGNSDTYAYTVTFSDAKEPEYTPLANPVITINMCNDVPDAPIVTATDECDDSVEVADDLVYTGPSIVNTDGERQFTRTWTAEDPCGNIGTIVQTVNLVDSQEPNMTIPEDVTFTCDETPVYESAVVIDDCDGDITQTVDLDEVTVTSNCGSEYFVVRTFTVSDGYNTVTKVQTVTIVDDGAPDLQDAPADYTIQDACDVPTPGDLTWSDCGVASDDVAVVTTSEEVEISGSCHYKVHTWTATDGCGNVSGAKQTVTIDDITPPVVNDVCPDIDVSCDEAVSFPLCSTVAATDNCDADGSVDIVHGNYTEVGTCNGEYSMIRTYNAQDSCGNDAIEMSQTLRVYDDEEPMFNMVPPTEIDNPCTDIEDAPVLTANDNCDGEVEVSYTETQVVEPYGYRFPETYIHTWTTQDNCGNTNSTTQTVTVVDTTPPTFFAIEDETKTCNDHGAEYDDEDYRITDPIIADDCCEPTLTKTFSDEGGADCPTIHTYEWTATDCAGNTHSDTATVTFPNDTPPTFAHGEAFATVYNDEPNCTHKDIVQPTATDDCDASITVSAAVVTDLADDRTVSFSSGVAASTGDIFSMKLRTWTVSDACGNSQTATQTSIVNDSTPPVLSCTDCDDDTMETCNANPPTPAITGTDNCLGVLSSQHIFSDETIETSDHDCLRMHIYTYSVTDDNGNTDSGTNTVTVEDTTENVLLSTPADMTKSCQEAATWTFADISYSDCGVTDPTPITATTETIPGSCFDTYKVVATWSNTDNCGNSVVHTQTIDFVDDEAPTLSYDATTITEECDNVSAAQTPTATDLCDDVVDIVDTTEQIPSGTCEGNYTIVNSWVATDNCGFTDSGSRTVGVYDTTPPTLSTICPDETIECDDSVPTCDTRTSSDTCELVELTGATDVTVTEETDVGTCTWAYDIIRTFSTTDECGHTTSDQQTITVEDTTPPTISGPSDVTAEVPKIPFSYDGDHSNDDNCGVATMECTERKVPGSCDHRYELVRDCVVTDDCGLTDIHTYTVDVQDNTPPVLTGVPDSITVEYNNVPAAADGLALVRATDNSDSVLTEAVTEEELSRTNAHEYILLRSFSVEDNCGNTVTETQTIEVEDTCPPTLNEEPADETVDCDAIPVACTLVAVGEDSLTVDFTTSSLDAPARIIRTWSVTDEADNTVSHTQTVTVVDNAAPILSRTPEDVTVDCSCEDFPAAPTVIALDNCDESVPVTYTEVRTDGTSTDVYTLTRTWSAVDDADNSVEHVQVITVEDNEAPVIYPVPSATLDANCATVPAIQAVSALDNCDTTASYTTTSVTVPGSCTSDYQIVHTFTAADRSGNSETWVQTVGVTDTAAPETDVLDDGCIMQGGSGSVSYTYAELFSAQEECSTATFNFVSCNVTASAAGAIVCSSTEFGVEIDGDFADLAELGPADVAVYATVSDSCGNSVNLAGSIYVHSEMSAATAGAEDCKVVVEGSGEYKE